MVNYRISKKIKPAQITPNQNGSCQITESRELNYERPESEEAGPDFQIANEPIEDESQGSVVETPYNETVNDVTLDEEIPPPIVYDITWNDPEGNHMQFNFDIPYGVRPELAGALIGSSPIEFYSLFLDSEILNLMVDQTNLYATQVLMSGQDISQYSRSRAWEPTSVQEMKKFVGILGYMGLMNLPSIRHYWSTKKLYRVSVLSEVMSRNRFELLLKFWHFNDNENCPDAGDRGYKLEKLTQSLLNKFQDAYTPGPIYCIDESLVPFRGRLIIKQYIPQKAHKYGVKLFKLCCSNGYTWNLKMYSGKERDPNCTVPTKIVMELSEKLLDNGRTAITDNYYTSLELARKLLDRQTHLLGTLRSNRKGNPTEVTKKALKVGEVIGKENQEGICIMKWKDKRDVLMLSTKHSAETATVNRRTGPVQKPIAVIDYNAAKSAIDLSDQMSSYNSALRKTIKWYRKIAIELLLGTAVVNAHFLYQEVNDKKISITEFREQIVENLLFPSDENQNTDMPGPSKKRKLNSHQFKKKDGPAHKNRKYCHGCYKKKQKGLMEKNKVPKVTTYCDDCEEKPHFCISCFAEYHK